EGMYIDPVLLKFDLNFNEIWNRTIYGNFDRIGSINQDISENVIVWLEKFNYSGGSNTQYLAKYNHSGSLEYMKNYTLYISDLLILSNNVPVILYNNFSRIGFTTLSEDGEILPPNESVTQEYLQSFDPMIMDTYKDGFLIMGYIWSSNGGITQGIKYVDSSFDLIWAYNFTSNFGSTYMRCLSITANDDILLAGTNSRGFLASGQIEFMAWMKLSDSGELLWMKTNGLLFRSQTPIYVIEGPNGHILSLASIRGIFRDSEYTILDFTDATYSHTLASSLQIPLLILPFVDLVWACVYLILKRKEKKGEKQKLSYSFPLRGTKDD
ncbi:MAG: hypothetical protein ACTSRK_19370, partial [Promethearchaeota archaeon]